MYSLNSNLLLRCARCRAPIANFLSLPRQISPFDSANGDQRKLLSSRISDKIKKVKQRRHTSLTSLIKPSPSPSKFPNKDDRNVGEDLTGPLVKDVVITLLNQFFRQPEVKSLSMQQGIEPALFLDAFSDFRKYCATVEPLPADLHIKLSDLSNGQGTVIDLFPFFLRHAKALYPHLECVDDLRFVSDLTLPANWFPLARSKPRKIVIHAGPTNSGKTYHAFQRYLDSTSGIYCGPLKLLAVEIAKKSNDNGIPCDLITGEDRKLADPEGKLNAAHVACTVEMTDLQRRVEVAIIDEIQMLRDKQRGWAWLRALLGVNADEVHVCGEETAIDIIKDLAVDTGDSVEVRRYQRLTPIEYMTEPLGNLANIQDGDCIVCFSKSHIYYLCRELEKLGMQCAVIYGSLPPGTKLAQAARFNDPDDPCKVLIATDAIGMGLNLNIRRVIFYSLVRSDGERGQKPSTVISPSQTLQIAGRCGRYGTTHRDKGYVTTFNAKDLDLMHELLHRQINPIEKAGIHPTADQIELFGYYLPHASLSDLIDIFTTLMTLDGDKYFLCEIEQFKQIADVIQHVSMPLRTRYVFCCSPIPLQSAFVTTALLKFARRFSDGQPAVYEWMQDQIDWPLSKPCTLNELTHLEAVHDALDLYCWLSYRFEDQFPDRVQVKEMQIILDDRILEGVCEITKLVNVNVAKSDLPDTDNKPTSRSRKMSAKFSRILNKISKNVTPK